MFGKSLVAVLLFVAGTTAPALAQAQADDGPPDFEAMRQRAEQHLKEMLDVKDEEWKVLQPKLQKIQQLQRDANARAMGMMMFGPGGPGGPGGGPVFIGPGGPPPGGGEVIGGGAPPGGPPPGGFGPGGPDQPPSAVQEKINDLRETLQNKDSTPDDIKAKVQALREARAQAKADLAKAQEDLTSVVTPKQEAVLLSLGYLD